MEETSNLFENSENNIQEASKGQRAANYIIDLIIVYILIFVIAYAIGIFLPGLIINMETGEPNRLTSYVIAIIGIVAYYTLFEAFGNGKSIGKLITGTRAVTLEGHKLSPKDALLRSLSRLVPFEVFSGFGPAPWHDKWTETMVVVSR